MNPAIAHKLSVYQLAIPMRTSVQHAVANRAVADPVIVELELAGGTRGFGESIARTYVTGETVGSVLAAIESTFVPVLLAFHANSFPEALEFAENLPWFDQNGSPAPAARGAVELAVLDASMRHFDRSVEDIVQWLGLPGLGRPGSMASVRFSGVLAQHELRSMKKQLRLMYWYGLRDFKIKVGADGDQDRVRAAAEYLARPLAANKASLRIDANGAWALDEASDWLIATSDLPIAGVEQPLPTGNENLLPELRGGTDALLIHDESLLTESDARRLIELGVADAFNIRISKCGGFLPSLRIAALARKHGAKLQLGCMVGETSLLSAVGLRFLQVCPEVHWAEGCFGPFLLRKDICKRPLRFRYGGRPPPPCDSTGWGLAIDDALLNASALASPKTFNF